MMRIKPMAFEFAIRYLTLAALLLGAIPAQGSEAPAGAGGKPRPRICLVLSGGGARGAAHIGVLKVLEEYRVPIDCIAGTSMGALVGASYATGTSVAELEQIIQGISSRALFHDKPPRQERSIRSKQDDASILFGFELGFHDGELELPKGAVSGVQLETVLRRLTKAKGFHNFDELPISFRAVATDLVTGKAVVLSKGEVANIMRASMSVPGAIAPAEIDGKILVDGGLTDNLPVDVARAMGADIVIAVNLGTPLLKRDELNSIVGVTGQMINILTEQNVQASLASLKSTDILILPELGDFSAADFDHLPSTLPIGEAAARKVADQLAPLGIPAAEYAALRQRQLAAAPQDLRPVDEIRFDALKRVNPESAQAIMDTKPGQPIDQIKLDRDMLRLFGTGDYEHVNYSFIEEPGKRVLAVDAVEKSWGPNYLRFGLGLSSDFEAGGSYFNILTSYRKTWLNSLGAEWRNDLQIGNVMFLRSEFYQPLDARGYFFVAPLVELAQLPVNLYQGDQRIARYDVKYARVKLDVGSQFTRYGELRLGVLTGSLDASLDTGPPELAPESDQTQGAITARLFFDQLDDTSFPRSGWGGSLNVFNSQSGLGAATEYTKWDVNGTAVYSFGEHTFNLGLKAGGNLGSEPLPRYDQFLWGGFLTQSGYLTGQLVGDSLTFGRLVYYNRLRSTMPYDLYAGFSLEAGEYGTPLVPGNPRGLLTSASVFLGADTPIGPIYLGYGRAADGNSSFYFYLGRP